MYDNYIKAGSPDTSEIELRALLADRNAAVRRRLAENPRTPDDVLLKLADDEHPEVRCAVAEHDRAPRTVMERLSNDANVQVRYAVAGQYSLPVDLLELLCCSDENPYVRDHARRTLEGIFLEQALKEAGFIALAGEKEKLGEILVDAEVLTQDQVQELVRISRERKMPLGHALVESRCVARSVVVAALKAQLAVRHGQMQYTDAIFTVKHVLGKL